MRYAIEMNDGSVAIMETFGDIDPAKEVKRWPAGESAKVVSINEIDESRMPASRELRNAWEFVEGVVRHNMTRAADMQMDSIRQVRNARLSALDKEVLAALGKNDLTAIAEIEAQKEILRDIPQTYADTFSSAKTIDDLKAIWPVELT
jgi:hypothetical protein